jgi:hypothetical protein
MLCGYCGVKLNRAFSFSPFRKPTACPKCTKILDLRLVNEQGDGLSGFREIMIRQNLGDVSRKLLETRSYHFVVFLNSEHEIDGFELTDRDETHMLKWKRGKASYYYSVKNVGRGYANHDQILKNGVFDPNPVIEELSSIGKNIRSDVLPTLLEGIAAYKPA